MRRRPHRRAWHGRVALVATDNGRVALVATDNGRVELPLDRKRRGENGRAGARPSLPPTFLHFYTAKAIPHDGEAPSPQCRTTARRTPLATACAAHFVRGICRHVWAVATSATLPHFSPNQSPNGQMQSQIVNRKFSHPLPSTSSTLLHGHSLYDDEGVVTTANPQIAKWPNAIGNRKS